MNGFVGFCVVVVTICVVTLTAVTVGNNVTCWKIPYITSGCTISK